MGAGDELASRLAGLRGQPGELRKVRAACDALLSRAEEVAGDDAARDDAARVWRAFERAARRRNLTLPGLGLALRVAGGALRGAAREAEAWLLWAFEPRNPTEIAAAELAAAECVFDFVLDAGVPLTPTSLVQQVRNIPALVERGYPGYAEAGLLSAVVQRRVGGGASL